MYINPFRFNLFRSLCNEPHSGFLRTGIREISFSAPLAFNITPTLLSMPTKRKKKVDPQILKLREERKRRKIEKEIRSLEKMKKILRPIEEVKIPSVLLSEMESRKRMVHLPENVAEDRISLFKSWCRYRWAQTLKDMKNIRRIYLSQEKALNELQKVSPELYNDAIQPIPDLIPFTFTGPSETPPIPNYKRLDGEYIDVSKNWFEQSKIK